MRKILLLLSCASFLWLSACKDDDGVAADPKSPEIEINVKEGDIVGDNVNLSFDTKDDEEINKIEIYVDGQLLTTLDKKPFTYNWNTLSLEDGQHTIKAIAFALNGNKTEVEVKVIVKNTLLALSVDENYLINDENIKERGFIIITDKNGKTIVVKEYANGSKINIARPAGFTSNEFAMTDVVAFEYLNDNSRTNIQIMTFFLKDIFEWKHKEDSNIRKTSSQIGEANINFINYPDNNSYASIEDMFFQKGFYLSEGLSFPMYQESTNALLKLGNYPNNTFKALENIRVGKSKEFDLSIVELNVFKSIKMPFSIDYNRYKMARIDGYLDSSENISTRLVDGVIVDDNIEFNYPKGLREKGVIQKFRTTFEFYIDGHSYYSEFIGSVPDEAKNIDVNFSLLSDSFEDFKVAIEGDWSIYLSHWLNYDDNNPNVFISWYVLGGKDNLQFNVQDIPSELKKIFPTFDTSKFKYEGTSVQKSSEFEDYQSFIKFVSETGEATKIDSEESYTLLVDFDAEQNNGSNERRNRDSKSKRLFGQFYIK